MRHTRSSSAAARSGAGRESAGSGPSTSGRGADRHEKPEKLERFDRHERHEQQLGLGRSNNGWDSPPRSMKRTGGPSMTAERFLMVVAQLLGRASELWEREEEELKRGAELMVINCQPPPREPQAASPVPPPSATPIKVEPLPFSPRHHLPFTPRHLPLLHNQLTANSPALLPAALHLGSPSWSDINTLGFGLNTLHDGMDDHHHGDTAAALAAAPGPSAAAGAAAGSQGGGAPAGEQQTASALHPGSGWPLSALGHLCDAEAFITLPGAFGLQGCGSARAGKGRQFDSGGPLSARTGLGPDMFAAPLCTNTGDDFLGSPFGGNLFALDTFR